MATRSEIIGLVKVKMDELTPFDEALIVSSGNDGVQPIADYIESILDETTREYLHQVPTHKVPESCIGTLGLISGVPLSITKPTDFIKILYIKLHDWERPVYEAIKTDNIRYKLQSNTYTKGGTAKPVVVETADSLEFYSSGTTRTNDVKKYVLFQAPESIAETKAHEAISWLCASKVLSIMGNELAKNAYDQFKIALLS